MQDKTTQTTNGQSSDTSPQTRANRANAQHSTGPRTEAGKKRSSLNALRHGLTGHLIVMPGEDLAVYERFSQALFDEHQPKTDTEKLLVQSIVDTSWKINRGTALENNLLMLGMTEHIDGIDAENPEVQQALAMAAAYRAESRMFANLSVQVQRLSRERERTIKQLLELQDKRREQERTDLHQAAKLLDSHKSKGLPYNPAEDGFVFANEQIEAYIRRGQRRREANRASYDWE